MVSSVSPNKDPEYCCLSEEWDPVQKNPQEISVHLGNLLILGAPHTVRLVGVLSIPLIPTVIYPILVKIALIV
jgi:hypothetical protein